MRPACFGRSRLCLLIDIASRLLAGGSLTDRVTRGEAVAGHYVPARCDGHALMAGGTELSVAAVDAQVAAAG